MPDGPRLRQRAATDHGSWGRYRWFVQSDFYRTEAKPRRQVLRWTKYSAREVEALGLHARARLRRIDDDTFDVPLAATIYGLEEGVS